MHPSMPPASRANESDPQLCICRHRSSDHYGDAGNCLYCDCKAFTSSQPAPAIPPEPTVQDKLLDLASCYDSGNDFERACIRRCYHAERQVAALRVMYQQEVNATKYLRQQIARLVETGNKLKHNIQFHQGCGCHQCQIEINEWKSAVSITGETAKEGVK